MKIAVLSDIHGNEAALDAVCADIRAQQADFIFILGDSISDFFHTTHSMLAKIQSLTDFVIRGNREIYMLDQSAGKFGRMWQEHKQFSTNLKTWQALSGEDLQYLSSLPQQLSMVFDDSLSLRLVHGSPFSEFDPIKEGADDLMRRSAEAIAEKILLCGHTHRPMVKEIAGKIIVNVGSVGVSFDKGCRAEYVLVHYQDGKIEIEPRKIPYDFVAWKASCDLSDPWTCLCLRSIEDAVNRNTEFLEEAQAICHCSPIPNTVWDQLAQEWRQKGRL